MMRFGLAYGGETSKNAIARDCDTVDAETIDDAFVAFTEQLRFMGAKHSATNDPSHVKHDPNARRFSHKSSPNGQYRVFAFPTPKPAKATLAANVDILTRAVAVDAAIIGKLAAKLKITDATIEQMRADIIAEMFPNG